MTALPAVVRQAVGQGRPSAVEPGQDPRNPADPDAGRRQVPPPPRVDPPRPDQPLRGDRADAAYGFRPGGFRPGGFQPGGFQPGGVHTRGVGDDAFTHRSSRADPFGPPQFEEVRAGRIRPLPSTPFLAQAIGQELDAEAGTAVASRAPRDVAGLYRQTRDAVDRALFGGLKQPPAGAGERR